MNETILCICDRIRPIRGGPEKISGKIRNISVGKAVSMWGNFGQKIRNISVGKAVSMWGNLFGNRPSGLHSIKKDINQINMRKCMG